MALFQMKSQSQHHELQEPEADYRTAVRVAQYRVGREAVYFPAFPGTRYLPYAAVDHAMSRPAALPVKACCGKSIPMIRVRLYYEGEFYQEFMLEKLRQADAILDALLAARPEVPITERAVDFGDAVL